MLFDERERFHAVLALANHIHFLNAFQQKGEFVARGLFVVDDDGVDGHMGGKLSIGKAVYTGNSIRHELACATRFGEACAMMRTERNSHAAKQGRPLGRKDSEQRNNLQRTGLWRAARRSTRAWRRARHSRSDHTSWLGRGASDFARRTDFADTAVSLRYAAVFVGAGGGTHRLWRERAACGGSRTH